MPGKLYIYSTTVCIAGYAQFVSHEPVPSSEWKGGDRTRYFIQIEGGARVFLTEAGARHAIEKMRAAHVNGTAETLQV